MCPFLDAAKIRSNHTNTFLKKISICFAKTGFLRFPLNSILKCLLAYKLWKADSFQAQHSFLLTLPLSPAHFQTLMHVLFKKFAWPLVIYFTSSLVFRYLILLLLFIFWSFQSSHQTHQVHYLNESRKFDGLTDKNFKNQFANFLIIFWSFSWPFRFAGDNYNTLNKKLRHLPQNRLRLNFSWTKNFIVFKTITTEHCVQEDWRTF